MAFFYFLMLCPHEFFRAHQILNIYLSIRHQQRFWTFSRMFYMFYLLFAEPVISLHMSLVAEGGVNVASCIDLTYLSKCCCAQLCNCLKMSILCFFFFLLMLNLPVTQFWCWMLSQVQNMSCPHINALRMAGFFTWWPDFTGFHPDL